MPDANVTYEAENRSLERQERIADFRAACAAAYGFPKPPGLNPHFRAACAAAYSSSDD